MIPELNRMLFGTDDNTSPMSVDRLLVFSRITRSLFRGVWSARIDLGNLVAVVRLLDIGDERLFEDDREILRYAVENGLFD